MANHFELRDLRYFEAIAEAGHVGKAAAKMFRTQPALSGSVRRLEAALGTSLFERVGRGIRLTAAGAALVHRARALRIAADDTVREIGEVGAGLAGQVRIGVLPTLARFLVPPLSRVFLKDSPGVTLKTVIAQNDLLGAHLEAGEIDLMVSTGVKASAELAIHPILRDEAVVIASHRHPVLRGKARIEDLLAYRWVLAPPSVGTRQWLERAFQSRGLPGPDVQIETNLILMMPTLIHKTELLTFTSRRHTSRADTGGALREVRVKETTMPRRFDVVYRRDGYLSPAAKKLLALLRARGEELFAEE